MTEGARTSRTTAATYAGDETGHDSDSELDSLGLSQVRERAGIVPRSVHRVHSHLSYESAIRSERVNLDPEQLGSIRLTRMAAPNRSSRGEACIADE